MHGGQGQHRVLGQERQPWQPLNHLSAAGFWRWLLWVQGKRQFRKAMLRVRGVKNRQQHIHAGSSAYIQAATQIRDRREAKTAAAAGGRRRAAGGGAEPASAMQTHLLFRFPSSMLAIFGAKKKPGARLGETKNGGQRSGVEQRRSWEISCFKLIARSKPGKRAASRAVPGCRTQVPLPANPRP